MRNNVTTTASHKVTRRIVAADGYLDLRLPMQAIEELAAIEAAGDMQPAVDYVMGQALMMQQRFDDAIEILQRAAENIPVPFSQFAWNLLAECLREQGQHELAEVVDYFAEEPPELVVQHAEMMGYNEFDEMDDLNW
ncbi:MAG: hypothetical protein KDA65_16375 [Planctomycetaceae bacterium]|nr:hypothetical protein [Planctomycetaceae bacterium]